ncbi:MAG: hypothetical protein HOE90_05555 [Bacteriovoracaceae bacterium]|jgi:predicted secreted hydrolase|nr:hypothetical protein [Bacteriovoracaceae bacterium]
MKILLIVTCILFYGFQSAYSQTWKNYPYQSKKSSIVFPDDEGNHPWVPDLEWWYVVMHVKGDISGDQYSILVTHFNNLFRFFTVTNVTKKTHSSGTAMGILKASTKRLDLTQNTKFGKDYMRTKKDGAGNLIPFEYELKTHHKDMNVMASLRSTKAPLMVGGSGYVDVGSSGKSWYYSNTRLDVKGVLDYAGIKEGFSGIAWMDHQWGPFLISPVEGLRTFESYEWFCIQLDDGSDIMISNIFNRKYQRPKDGKHGGIEIYYPDGKWAKTEDVEFTRVKYWKDPDSGHVMSMGWKVVVPAWGLDINLTPDFEHQMVNFPLGGDFWEGSIHVTGKLKKVSVKGKAYGELVHRYKKPKIALTRLTKNLASDSLGVSWKVKNPDAGNPLNYDLFLYSGKKVIKKINGLKKNSYILNSASTLLKSGQRFRVKIVGSSVDGLLKGHANSKKQRW